MGMWNGLRSLCLTPILSVRFILYTPISCYAVVPVSCDLCMCVRGTWMAHTHIDRRRISCVTNARYVCSARCSLHATRAALNGTPVCHGCWQQQQEGDAGGKGEGGAELRAEKETYSIWSWSWNWSWKTMYCCAISLTSDAPENCARIGREWNVRWHWRGMLHRRMLPQRWQVKLIRASIKYEINAEIWYDRSCRVVPRQETGNVLSATWQRHCGRRGERQIDGQADWRKLTTVVSCQLSCGCIKREAFRAKWNFKLNATLSYW